MRLRLPPCCARPAGLLTSSLLLERGGACAGGTPPPPAAWLHCHRHRMGARISRAAPAPPGPAPPLPPPTLRVRLCAGAALGPGPLLHPAAVPPAHDRRGFEDGAQAGAPLVLCPASPGLALRPAAWRRGVCPGLPQQRGASLRSAPLLPLHSISCVCFLASCLGLTHPQLEAGTVRVRNKPATKITSCLPCRPALVPSRSWRRSLCGPTPSGCASWRSW